MFAYFIVGQSLIDADVILRMNARLTTIDDCGKGNE